MILLHEMNFARNQNGHIEENNVNAPLVKGPWLHNFRNPTLDRLSYKFILIVWIIVLILDGISEIGVRT